MTLLPSPIPHPLDYCPWDVPGWVYEALDWVIGVEWPEGDERSVWNLADQWYEVAGVLGVPRDDATTAAGEVRSGYGGVGLVAETFDIAWHKLADGADAPLHALLAVTSEMGRLVESCGCDIEGAKLEAWIELGILVIELLSLAVVTVATAGVASPAIGAATTASRVAVQQIFKRLVAQLARKAIKEGLREASERAAKEVVKTGARGLARRAVIGGLIEAGQEVGTNLATQAYQNSTGRRDGLDLADVGASGLGGFAGGAAAPLAGLGGHAHGRFTQIGEHFAREMGGETLAEAAAGLANGQVLSLEDAARAAVSGVSGSVTGQADAALHQRLDGKLAGLAGQPVDLALPSGDDPVPGIPAQRAADPPGPVSQAADALGPTTPPHPATPVPDAADGRHVVPTAEPRHSSSAVVQVGVDPDPSRPHVEAAASPLLSSVAVTSTDPATAPPPVDPRPAHGSGSGGPEPGAPNQPTQPAPNQPTAAPGVATGPVPQAAPNGPPRVAPEHLTAGAAPAHSGPLTEPTPHRPALAPAVDGSQDRSVPGPRPPLSAPHAPDPHHPAHAASFTPALPGTVDPRPPRFGTPEERAAWLAADREALDRRRYQGYLQSQRELYEENRRRRSARELRDAVEQQYEAVRWLFTQGQEWRAAGRPDLAEQYWREGQRRERLAYRWTDQADAVLDGTLVPDEVVIDDPTDFYRINADVADLAYGAVDVSDVSALTGDGHPPPIDRSRPYGERGGLRPPLALHQTDLERQMPRNPDGSVARTADPRVGDWFGLANDGGPLADATRSINCLDCTLSLYETWMHGRPRVSAPRTFDGYLQGDVRCPIGGEADGPMRVEEVTGGCFQNLVTGPDPTTYPEAREQVERGYGDLHRQLLGGGHGSYAFLITSFEGGGAHAWVALNQNGTVLYLDPQNGTISERPLLGHRGAPHRANTIGIDALVLGPDGRPMPLAGRPPGTYNVLPELSERPEPPPPPAPYDSDEPAPDFNHVHLLGQDTTINHPVVPPPGSVPNPDGAEVQRQAHLDAHAGRISAGLFVRDAVAASRSLDEAFAAGVTPVELAQHLDAPTLRRLVPGLDESGAGDVARLLDDPRVRQMLDQTWEAPPRGEPLLAETLVRQLAQRPDLARMILATPELANSLTARPVTLHQLADRQQAIDVLGNVLQEIEHHGCGALIRPTADLPVAVPLTSEQRQVSAGLAARRQRPVQLGFDEARMEDEGYRRAYVEKLYADAAEAQPELNQIAIRSAGDRGRAAWRTEPKKRSRVMDKLVEYANDASRLKDLAGARVEFDSLDDLYRALSDLANDSSVLVLDVKDRFKSPQGSGYCDVLLNLRMSNGHVAELRLQLGSLESVAKWEHALYEVRRDLETLSQSDGRPLTQMETAIRDGLLQRAERAYRRAIEEGLGEMSDEWQASEE
ncbi:toxin glutamine deamidase domain-containing protein [Micromonospora auratinigra]|uniref:RelA/SpoT domain-containing protein n=1 Tax=Micromonospora auratinigra TaxID=261654 RepID=A0A1A9A7P8_9ACTN|nr:toxin glutamine deamidase domain-containing protein [Micromonospora auratinigra]SBT52227.1 hypothetical protein GA0070611_5537 [Micromonospora auratinigra]